MLSTGKIYLQRCNVMKNPLFHKKCFATTLTVINPQTGGEGDGKKKKKQSKHRKQRGAASYKFVDKAKIRVNAGNGGKGCISYESKLGSSYKRRPNGGHGGHGGNVIIVADDHEQSLNMQSHHHKGEDGKNGSSKQMHGRRGKDKIIRVPCGVVVNRVLEFNEVWDADEQTVKTISLDNEHEWNSSSIENQDPIFNSSNDHPEDYDEVVNTGIKSDIDGMYHWESQNVIDDDELVSSSEMIYEGEREKVMVADLDVPGSYVVVVNGGRGGVGNSAYAKRQHIPDLIAASAEKAQGKPGEVAHLELELKLIADIGLVGFPNAGKSSLLAAMSKAQPEIAPYPFTTLHPLVGTLEYRDGFRAIVADVPGLVGGAADGRGRGHDFLRHLERTKALLYIVDTAGVDGRDPLKDLEILVDEIKSYGDSDMMTRPALVVANKLDLMQNNDLQDEILLNISNAALDFGINFDGEVHGISAGVTGEGLGGLSTAIRTLVESAEVVRAERNEDFNHYELTSTR